jgi:hypothetical protein
MRLICKSPLSSVAIERTNSLLAVSTVDTALELYNSLKMGRVSSEVPLAVVPPACARIATSARENPRAKKAIPILPRQAFEHVIFVTPRR